MPRALLAIAVILLAARVGVGAWERRHPPAPLDHVRWVPIATAEAESRRLARPILYDFNAAWCEPCKRMAADVFADRQSAADINRWFVPVRVVDRSQEDGRNAPDVQTLQDRFRVEAFPTLIVSPMDTDTQPVKLEGYPGRAATLQHLRMAMLQIGSHAIPDSAARSKPGGS
jgi:thiol:disulfide interchange protein